MCCGISKDGLVDSDKVGRWHSWSFLENGTLKTNLKSWAGICLEVSNRLKAEQIQTGHRGGVRNMAAEVSSGWIIESSIQETHSQVRVKQWEQWGVWAEKGPFQKWCRAVLYQGLLCPPLPGHFLRNTDYQTLPRATESISVKASSGLRLGKFSYWLSYVEGGEAPL